MDIHAVKTYLLGLQDAICAEFEDLDHSRFITDSWVREEGGGGRSRVLAGGDLIEKGGVNFSHVMGASMPGSATHNRPELAGRSFQAMGVSLVIHPNNPFVPTAHANVRFFVAEKEGEDPIWWFGGGYDLTPYYGFDEDCKQWHTTAKAACDPFGDEVYSEYKQWCDTYFYLPHRNEARGVGGLFFDDLNKGGFDRCFALMRAVGDSYMAAYRPIVNRRRHQAFNEGHKDWQLYRRGRYVEFNLVYDRGTLFGLQSNGRTESILMSLPPLVRWEYAYEPPAGSPESELLTHYLKPRDWVSS